MLAALLALLMLFPRPFIARAAIVPQDTSASAASTTQLLSALGGSAQGIGSLLSGGKASNDLYMIIGRSTSVKNDVINRLQLVGPGRRFPDFAKATLWLDRHLDVHLLLGGVVEIETKLHEPAEAVRITEVYADSIGRHLANYGKLLTGNKRAVVSRRLADANRRIGQAEAALGAFRRANNLAEPEQQLSNALVQRASLQGQLQAKEIEYQTQSRVRGPESTELLALRSDIGGLRAQLARTAAPATGPAGPNVAGLTAIQLRYLELYRNLRFQQSVYDVYQRSAEQVAVEELATESATYIQTIDPAHIVPERQYNTWAMALLAALGLFVIFVEWYAPATGLFRDRVLSRPAELTGSA